MTPGDLERAIAADCEGYKGLMSGGRVIYNLDRPDELPDGGRRFQVWCDYTECPKGFYFEDDVVGKVKFPDLRTLVMFCSAYPSGGGVEAIMELMDSGFIFEILTPAQEAI